MYGLLLDAFYATEKPLPLDDDELCVIARADVSRAAVRKALERYWRKTPEGWLNARAEKEISDYQDRTSKARTSAGKRWDRGRNANA